MSPGCRKLDLRSGRADTTERLHDRQPEALCEILRLIEATLPPAARMERDGNDDVRVPQEVGTRHAHARSQRAPDRTPPLVFERVDDFAQRAIVKADRAPAIDRAPPTPAADAPRHGGDASAGLSVASGLWQGDERTPRRQRIAARFAQRRRDRADGLPAAGADGTGRWAIEEACAAGAGRSEKNGDQRVEGGRADAAVHERDQPGSAIGSALPQRRSRP
jgi:hypothetical protein